MKDDAETWKMKRQYHEEKNRLRSVNRSLRAQVEQQRQEIEEYAVLTDRLGELLTGVACALKGPPKPLHMHDFSDLPALAAQLMVELKEHRLGSDVFADMPEDPWQ